MKKIFILSFIVINLGSFGCGLSIQSRNKQQLQKSIANGKTLFMGNCAACHSPTRRIVGYPFQHEVEFYGKWWTYNAIRNFPLLVENDTIAMKLFKMNFQTATPAFPHLTDKEIEDILNYVDSFPFDENSKEYEHRRIIKQVK
jgi:mono/diheme cytochrome c family protein